MPRAHGLNSQPVFSTKVANQGLLSGNSGSFSAYIAENSPHIKEPETKFMHKIHD
jgi:hypothetical protein